MLPLRPLYINITSKKGCFLVIAAGAITAMLGVDRATRAIEGGIWMQGHCRSARGLNVWFLDQPIRGAAHATGRKWLTVRAK